MMQTPWIVHAPGDGRVMLAEAIRDGSKYCRDIMLYGFLSAPCDLIDLRKQ